MPHAVKQARAACMGSRCSLAIRYPGPSWFGPLTSPLLHPPSPAQELAGGLQPALGGPGAPSAAVPSASPARVRAPAAAAAAAASPALNSHDEAITEFEEAVGVLLARTTELRAQARSGKRSVSSVIDDAAKQFIAPLRAAKFAAATSGNIAARDTADKAMTRMEAHLRQLKAASGASRQNPEAVIDKLMMFMLVRGWGS